MSLAGHPERRSGHAASEISERIARIEAEFVSYALQFEQGSEADVAELLWEVDAFGQLMPNAAQRRAVRDGRVDGVVSVGD